jgi:hypothetical protein
MEQLSLMMQSKTEEMVSASGVGEIHTAQSQAAMANWSVFTQVISISMLP